MEVDYKKMICLIKTDDGAKVIRFFYYVKDNGRPDGDFRREAQNTLIVKQGNAREIFEEAKKKGLF